MSEFMTDYKKNADREQRPAANKDGQRCGCETDSWTEREILRWKRSERNRYAGGGRVDLKQPSGS